MTDLTLLKQRELVARLSAAAADGWAEEHLYGLLNEAAEGVSSLLADMEALKGERDEEAAALKIAWTQVHNAWQAAEARATALEERVRELRQAVEDRKEIMALSSPPCTAEMIRAAHKAVDDAVDALLALPQHRTSSDGEGATSDGSGA